MSYQHQDWDPVVIHSKTHNQIAGKMHQNPAGTKRRKELEEGGVIPQLKTITHEQSQALMSARNAKGIDMTGLAKLVPYLDVKTIQEYENGKTTNFSLPLYNKMMRALNVKSVK